MRSSPEGDDITGTSPVLEELSEAQLFLDHLRTSLGPDPVDDDSHQPDKDRQSMVFVTPHPDCRPGEQRQSHDWPRTVQLTGLVRYVVIH